jgi:hypothetical protein
MIRAKRSFERKEDWLIEIGRLEGLVVLSDIIVCGHRSVSLNNEKICCKISENNIAVCEKTACLRCRKFSDLNSACSKVLVPTKIFQSSQGRRKIDNWGAHIHMFVSDLKYYFTCESSFDIWDVPISHTK